MRIIDGEHESQSGEGAHARYLAERRNVRVLDSCEMFDSAIVLADLTREAFDHIEQRPQRCLEHRRHRCCRLARQRSGAACRKTLTKRLHHTAYVIRQTRSRRYQHVTGSKQLEIDLRVLAAMADLLEQLSIHPCHSRE